MCVCVCVRVCVCVCVCAPGMAWQQGSRLLIDIEVRIELHYRKGKSYGTPFRVQKG